MYPLGGVQKKLNDGDRQLSISDTSSYKHNTGIKALDEFGSTIDYIFPYIIYGSTMLLVFT